MYTPAVEYHHIHHHINDGHPGASKFSTLIIQNSSGLGTDGKGMVRSAKMLVVVVNMC